jgi:hypothetical protein
MVVHIEIEVRFGFERVAEALTGFHRKAFLVALARRKFSGEVLFGVSGEGRGGDQDRKHYLNESGHKSTPCLTILGL